MRCHGACVPCDGVYDVAGVMASWCHSVVFVRCHGIVVSQCHVCVLCDGACGVVRRHGIVVSQCRVCCVMVHVVSCNVMASWCHSVVVSCHVRGIMMYEV